LLNNNNEDDDLKKKLGYYETADINKVIPIIKSDNHNIINNNLREEMRYNSKTGRKFFDDYFLTNKYFEEFLIRKNNKKCTPFTEIANEALELESIKLGPPFNWGKPGPSTKCGK
jgi:hypothetical protein